MRTAKLAIAENLTAGERDFSPRCSAQADAGPESCIGPAATFVESLPANAEPLRGWTHALKLTAAWQEAQWRARPRPEDWPAVMDLYLSAAYLSVSYATVRKHCVKDRAGKAALRHQRIGSNYRIRRADLDRLGAVESRQAF